MEGRSEDITKGRKGISSEVSLLSEEQWRINIGGYVRMNGLDESERRERERAEEASSGESWTHLLCSTRLGKKTPELTCVLRYTYTHTFVWRFLATPISARVNMHPQWINTVKDIALAHTHTCVQSPKQLSRVPAQWLQHPSTNRWKVLLRVACLKWSAALSLRGDVGTCAFHLTLHCGTLRLPVGCVCGWRSQPHKREGLLTTNTRLVHRWYGSSLCVSMGREKKLHLHDQKNPEGSILYTRHTERRLSSLKRTHCSLDWMLFKAWHLDYFQIFPSF